MNIIFALHVTENTFDPCWGGKGIGLPKWVSNSPTRNPHSTKGRMSLIALSLLWVPAPVFFIPTILSSSRSRQSNSGRLWVCRPSLWIVTALIPSVGNGVRIEGYTYQKHNINKWHLDVGLTLSDFLFKWRRVGGAAERSSVMVAYMEISYAKAWGTSVTVILSCTEEWVCRWKQTLSLA